MPVTYTRFNSADRQKVAKDVVVRATRCCATAEAALSSFDTRTKEIFKKWFGTILTKDARDDRGIVPANVNRMNYYIKHLVLVISDAGGTLGPTTNAMATHFGNNATTSYQDRQARSNPATGVKIQLTDIFFNNLRRVQSNDQTQIETLIHELSHVAAGTLDQDKHPTNPQPCYGRIAATTLAKRYPDQARNNAENYGFFIAEIGGETALNSVKAPAGSGGKWAVVNAPKLVR